MHNNRVIINTKTESLLPVYYNEWDKKTAAWLRELIKAKLIPDGVVDERSITEIQPADLAGFRQCHFFAGIGGWAYALQIANWPEEREVWTGSCPCQPWSGANVWQGGGRGALDHRHLWPRWFELIRQCAPAIIFGEQVPGAINKGWLDAAFDDLEAIDYACGSAVVPACAIQADHKRSRLWFVADSRSEGWARHKPVKRVPFEAKESQPVYGNSVIRPRGALVEDFIGVLPRDGLSVEMERMRVRGYGNAIHPQVAAEFIQAFLEAEKDLA